MVRIKEILSTQVNPVVVAIGVAGGVAFVIIFTIAYCYA